jgi:hypothetical protein
MVEEQSSIGSETCPGPYWYRKGPLGLLCYSLRPPFFGPFRIRPKMGFALQSSQNRELPCAGPTREPVAQSVEILPEAPGGK